MRAKPTNPKNASLNLSIPKTKEKPSLSPPHPPLITNILPPLSPTPAPASRPHSLASPPHRPQQPSSSSSFSA